MKKKIIAFDLDGTLADSKSQITDRMAKLLGQLLDKFHVCVMSGGKFEQFESQLLAHLKVEPGKLVKLHVMPTCGTRYYTYDPTENNWKQEYAEDFSNEEKTKVIAALNKGVDDCGFREKKTWGDTIEDRGSQITFSALGQDIVDHLGAEGVRLKEAWDPDVTKKKKLRKYVAALIPEFEVRIGGGTSIDITKPGIDKAYGMKKIMGLLNASMDEILFIGDRLQKGGNDYPVKAMGVDSIEISHWRETAIAVEVLVHATS